MSVLDDVGMIDGTSFREDVYSRVDARTREIVERRRAGTIRRRGWLVRRLLLVADLAGLVLALLLAEWLVNRRHNLGVLSTRNEVIAFLLSLPGWVVIAKLYGLYDRDEERTDHSTADDVAGVFHMVTVCTFLFWAFSYTTSVAHPTASKLVIFWAAAVGFISIGRAGARSVARSNVAYIQNTVIVGAGEVGQVIARKLLQHPEYGLNLVGFVDELPEAGRPVLGHFTLLGGADRLPALVQLFDVERVIVAFSTESHERTLELVRSLSKLDIQIDLVPRLFELIGPGVSVHTVEGLPLMGLPPVRLSRSSAFLKRCLDIGGAVVGLIVFAPFFVIVAVAIKLDSRGPVFFRQVRMGARGRTFRIVKFRTMEQGADERKGEVAHLNKHAQNGGDPRMFKIDDDPRVTPLGRLLRRSSLDELPQLWNVLIGEMSLVGPRPLILDEHQYVRDWCDRRLDLRPGMTGLWQVQGRHDIPFSEMVTLDYLYVVSWSLGCDLRLLLRTIPAVLRSGA